MVRIKPNPEQDAVASEVNPETGFSKQDEGYRYSSGQDRRLEMSVVPEDG